MSRVVGFLRAAAARLRDPAIAAMTVACLVIAGMYACNHDMGGPENQHARRGDGVYRPVLARGDGHMLYLIALSTVLDGDWRFDDELAAFGDPWGQPRTATGRKGIPHPVGPALVWAPFLAGAHVTAKAANLVGADIPEHGYDPWHQRIVFFTSVLFACGAVLLGRRLAARITGARWAPTYAAVAVLLGTSLTYYGSVMPSYGHAMDAFFCSAFLAWWATTLGRDDVRRHVALGVLLGISMLIRVQEVALGVVLAVEIAVRGVQALRDRDATVAARAGRVAAMIGRGVLTLAVAIVTFAPQLAMWKIVYGTFTLPQGDAYTRWGTPMIPELLWSARNGWLVTTPVVYLALLGLATVPARARLLGAGLIAAVLVQVYLNSVIMDWWGQASFGSRRLCDVTLPVLVGLAALLFNLGRLVARWRRVPRAVWHAVAIAVLGSMVAWNLSRVWGLHGGKPAPTTHAPTCCSGVPRPLRGVAQAIYDVVGNPLELPASAVFALWHDTSLKRWDQAVGDYPVILDGGRLADNTWRRQTGKWNLAGGGGAPYLLEGFGPTQTATRPFRWTTAPRARALVPNLVPAAQRFSVWLAPGGDRHVRLRYEGRVVADVDLVPGWQMVSFEIAAPPVGSNELWIETAPAPLPVPDPGAPAGALPPRRDGGPVGVAVGVVEVAILGG